MDLDFGKLAGLNGLSTHTVIVQRAGRNASADYIGDNLGTVQEIYGGGGNVLAHLVYTYAELELANRRIDIAAGRLPVGTFFAASPLYCAFVNVLTCGNPHPIPNYPGEPDWPAATFGGQVRVLPTVDTYLMAGVFQVNPNFGGRSGFSWGQPGTTGVSFPLEAGYAPRFGADRLVGHYKLGFDYDSSRYPDLYQDGAGQPFVLSGNAARSRRSRNEYYVLVDQMLLRTGRTDTDGVVVLGGYVHADRDISPLADQAFGGVLSSAAVIGRPKDSFGAMFHYIRTSGRLTATQELEAALGRPLTSGGFGPVYGVQSHEEVVELQYTAHVYGGVTVEPDFQYIVRPGATGAVHDAAVLGVRTNVQFQRPAACGGRRSGGAGMVATRGLSAMRGAWFALPLLLSLPLSAAPPDAYDTLSRLVGHSKAELIQRFGPPADTVTTVDGERLFYETLDTGRVGGVSGRNTRAGGPGGFGLFPGGYSFRCKTEVVIADNRVRAFNRSGNDCR